MQSSCSVSLDLFTVSYLALLLVCVWVCVCVSSLSFPSRTSASWESAFWLFFPCAWNSAWHIVQAPINVTEWVNERTLPLHYVNQLKYLILLKLGMYEEEWTLWAEPCSSPSGQRIDSTKVVNTFGGYKLFGGKEQKPHWDSKRKTDCRSRNQKVGVKAKKEDEVKRCPCYLS